MTTASAGDAATTDDSSSNHRRLSDVILRDLDLPRTLQERLHFAAAASAVHPAAAMIDTKKRTYVLYLPTVNLRSRQNPAFALAVRLANHYHLPLLIVGVVLDDAHLHHTGAPPPQSAPNTNNSAPRPVCHTARKVAFTLQAYQKAAASWTSEHGAACFVRVHGNATARTPHHLTLAHQATVVVLDEPFVHPYRQLVETVERSVAACVRVDGSTTVPPVCMLRRSARGTFTGVPEKAWKWEKQTASKRREHVVGAVQNEDFDAPELIIKCPVNAYEETNNPISQFLPKDWKDGSNPAPGKRAWSAQELAQIVPEDWVKSWPGIDTSVPVCSQTNGGDGWTRWKRFQQIGLARYAKGRNDIRQPHAVSRLSCYLNLGTIPIFQIVHELWNDKRDTAKYEDEIIKWREIGYAHTFASTEYFGRSAVPLWACRYLDRVRDQRSHHGSAPCYSLEQLSTAQTRDNTWNAMQRYLMETGELHNNARMTWGKTIVGWWHQQRGGDATIEALLQQMAYLNDRYALDGLSPPSYAGLLWCLGWCDKPGSGGCIPSKPASRYRVPPDGFDLARRRLLTSQQQPSITIGSTAENAFCEEQSAAKKLKLTDEGNKNDTAHGSIPAAASAKKTPKPSSQAITFYFSAKSPAKMIG
jgi:hypothetical protein